MLGNGVTSFAAKDIIQAGLSTAFVPQAEKVLERIGDTPAGEEVDRDVELVFGRHIGRIAVPLENPIVDRIDVLDERYLDLQAGGRHRSADRLAELGAATSPEPWAAWPRPMRSTPRRSPPSQSGSDRRHGSPGPEAGPLRGTRGQAPGRSS